jgi:hypothetical protein
MFQIPDDIEVGQRGEYHSTCRMNKGSMKQPFTVPFIVDYIQDKRIILKYDKVYEKETFTNLEKRDFGVLSKRRKNNKQGWCFFATNYKYAHEEIYFY